ncbi:uncharacterized protein Pyn_24984 [Prunus yedoensis var. nudiflora]|uniref:VWFA domain-containing protein n=1 Tax=Prunus yedoensis var. nudiflora TaxID=2094558 RepID=A0A314YXC8_PRUYE|nr:uncharacterized protein Pyn_24984 [Prunus yedoensis var. nudiflora]
MPSKRGGQSVAGIGRCGRRKDLRDVRGGSQNQSSEPIASETASLQRRAPIDLVTVVDVSASASNAKIQMMKRAMRLIVSSLRDTDRLSIVAFSSTSKRLLPLQE